MSKAAAEAAFRVLESSGLNSIKERSNIFLMDGQYTVRFY
jgi:hypothetical protein